MLEALEGENVLQTGRLTADGGIGNQEADRLMAGADEDSGG